jgi:hypothetical protein
MVPRLWSGTWGSPVLPILDLLFRSSEARFSVLNPTDDNTQRWTNMFHGGHFAAAEEPDLLADDIRTFFRRLRK